MCSKTYTTENSLNLHLKDTHSLIKKFTCDKCDKKFYQSSCLNQHIKNEFCGHEALNCNICERSFITEMYLKMHLKSHYHEKSTSKDNKYKCQKCGEDFDGISDLMKHAKTHEKFFNCQQCLRSFNVQSDLEQHVSEVHSFQRFCLCKFCHIKFRDRICLNRHLMEHYKIRLFSCHHCDRKFNLTYDLDEHLQNEHHGVLSNKCSICDSRLSKNPPFVRKLRKFKTGKISNKTETKCGFCFKVFKGLRVPYRHRKIHSKELPYRCQDCHMDFPLKEELINHIGSDSCPQPLKCNLCPRKFSKNYTLQYHLKTHVRGTANSLQKCNLCPKIFLTPSMLVAHRETHLKTKSNKCLFCNKWYKNTEGKSFNRKGQDFGCEICDESFFKKSDLTRHLIMHFVDRPTDCRICTNKFSDFAAHYLEHFDSQNFDCSQCTKKFSLQTSLYNHTLTHTDNFLPPADIDQLLDPSEDIVDQGPQVTNVETCSISDQVSDTTEIHLMDSDDLCDEDFLTNSSGYEDED